MDTQVYIYVLKHPVTLEVRYVGKTVDLKKRLAGHLNEKGCNRKCRWVQAVLSEGLVPLMEVLEIVSEDTWQEREISWIKYYRGMNVELCNLTDGGEGLHGCTEETRAKMSVLQKDRWQNEEYRDKILTEARALNLSRALRGKPKSEEHVAKLWQNQPGRIFTEEHKAKMREAHCGRVYKKRGPLTEEHKEKLRESSRGNRSRTGMKNSEEMNRNIGNGVRGIKRSDETKERMRQARIKYWQERKEKETEK